jgi:hypothetical protein
MRIRYLYYIAFILIVLAAAGASNDRAGDIQYNEHQLKAAYLYNFIKCIDWPEDKPAEPNKITIGILGEDKFGDSFDAVSNKPVNDKTLIIKRFGNFDDLCKNADGKTKNPCADEDMLKKCHLLFVCKSEKPNFEQIINAVSGIGVLTVGECDGFIEAGGIINFIPSDNKLTFEVNVTAAKQARIKINSRVLRLAKRVIGEKTAEAQSSDKP